MSFLAPLFLLGGLAVALPVVFHLVRRSSREKLPFSSLMFLKPTPPRLTRRSRLEHIFLLLLRCLVIGLLAFAFARPFLQKPMAVTPVANASSQIVVLVDASASMKQDGLWPAALAKAESVLKQTTPADQVAILTFDNRVRNVVTFDQWATLPVGERNVLALQQLAGNQPTWHATHLANALIAAAEVMEDTGKRTDFPGPRRIVVITDLQEGSRLDGLQGHEWPQGVEVAIESVPAERPTNAGLQWVAETAEDTRATTDSVRVRVSNSADAKREQFKLRWSGATETASLDAYVPPGQSRIMPAPTLTSNAIAGRISLSGDDADFDNHVYVVPPSAEQINVLYLGTDAATDPTQLLYYLERAFQDTSRQSVRLSATPGSLATNRLVILSDNLPDDRLTAVRQYMAAGGTTLLVMNDPQIGRALSQLTGVPNLEVREASVANYAMFGALDFTHPLLAPFADPRFGDFTKIRFWKHRKLSSDQLPGARVIAHYDDQDPAILEIPIERGRLFVFTFSWRPGDSQFALSSKFVPLLYSLLDQAGGGRESFTQVRVGEAVDLTTLTTKTGGANLSVRTPNGDAIELAAGETRFAQTDQPGIYEVQAGAKTVRFAVNLDASESRTAPLPVEELERLGVPMKSAERSPAMQAATQQTLHHAELEARQKLWRWLIVAALAVLLVETWLAGWLTRRQTAPVTAAT